MRREVPVDRLSNAPRALIIAPTRELAVQIHNDAEILGQYTGLTLGLAFGGVDYDKQRHHLEQGVDVLIGTPGRLIDFYKQRVFDLRAVQVLILDEADRMFDLGFITDIRYIMRRLPAPDQRLNLLFSATLAQRVLELAFEHMNDPELVRIEPDKMTVDARAAGHLLPVDGRKAAAARRPAQADGPDAHDGLREHAARRRGTRRRAARRTASTPKRCPATCRRKSACA